MIYIIDRVYMWLFTHSYVMLQELDIINYWEHCKMHHNRRSLST